MVNGAHGLLVGMRYSLTNLVFTMGVPYSTVYGPAIRWCCMALRAQSSRRAIKPRLQRHHAKGKNTTTENDSGKTATQQTLALRPISLKPPTSCAATWNPATTNTSQLGLIFLKYISDAVSTRTNCVTSTLTSSSPIPPSISLTGAATACAKMMANSTH